MNRNGAASDVIVIGGGIAGLSTAYFLAKRGIRVTLLEKGRLAWEQSSRNWGFIRQQGRDPAELPMALLSLDIWSQMAQEPNTDVEWCRGGNLAIAYTEDDLDRYAEGARSAQAVGLDTRVLTAKEVADLVPELRGNFVGGLHTASDAHADPLKGSLAFAARARAAGADLREYCPVNAILASGGRVTGVATDAGELKADVVVCAAGVHTSFLARSVGLRVPQRGMRATVVATEPMRRFTGLGIWAGGLGIRQRRDGSVVIGRASAGTAEHDLTLESVAHFRLFLPIFMRNRDLFRLRFGMPFVRDLMRRIPGTGAAKHPFAHMIDHEPNPSPKTMDSSIRLFNERFPGLAPAKQARAWAGVIEATPDLVPVLGEVESLRGLFLATGFSGHGFGLGPGAGHTLAEVIATGHSPLDIHAMRYERFAEGDLSKARKIL